MSGIDDYEREVKRQLADLQREYQERAYPLVKALADIRALQPTTVLITDPNMLPLLDIPPR